MRNKIVLLISAMALASYSLSAFAVGISYTDYHQNNLTYQSFKENFSPSSNGKSNVGAWSYNDPNTGLPDRDNGLGDIVKSENGKYAIQIGRHHNRGVFHPSFGTHELSSPFTGDYVKKQVVSLSFEFRVLKKSPVLVQRPVTLVLRGEDGFTLYKTLHGCAAAPSRYCPNIPELPSVWTKETFSIPQDWIEAKKDGWDVYKTNGDGINYKLKDHFASVMSDVEKVDFMLGNPRLVYNIEHFVTEATNVTITQTAHKQ